MTNQDPSNNREAVNDYQRQARDFLAKSRGYLADNKLHQAAEKGWDAAVYMAKAVAYGWEYERRRDFSTVLNNAYLLTRNSRLLDLRSRANDLSQIQYERKRYLDGAIIGEDIESVAELLDLLAPLLAADAAPGDGRE